MSSKNYFKSYISQFLTINDINLTIIYTYGFSSTRSFSTNAVRYTDLSIQIVIFSKISSK
jgi:hypothetical protein